MSYRGRSVFFAIIERFVGSLKPKNWRDKPELMGTDYLGNKYFECRTPKDLYDSRKQSKRWFEPPNEDLWDRQLPPEWNAWLRRGRLEPPTVEEIERNLSVESMKKEYSLKYEKSSENEVKGNPFSSFPSYPDYDESQKSKQ